MNCLCALGQRKSEPICVGFVGGVASLFLLPKSWLVLSFVCLLNVCTVIHRVTANVRRLCDGAVIAFRQPSFALKLNRITEVEHITSSRTIAKPIVGRMCYFFSLNASMFCILNNTSSKVIISTSLLLFLNSSKQCFCSSVKVSNLPIITMHFELIVSKLFLLFLRNGRILFESYLFD